MVQPDFPRVPLLQNHHLSLCRNRRHVCREFVLVEQVDPKLQDLDQVEDRVSQ